MPKALKPGIDNAPAGIYHETSQNGVPLKNGKTVSIGADDRLPPTPKPKHKWLKK